MFQHTAARRRLVDSAKETLASANVSTHSRPKAAGYNGWNIPNEYSVSTHSRLKAAGFGIVFSVMVLTVSTHSRLKAAGNQEAHLTPLQPSFNTQPPEGGWNRRADY